MGLAGGCNFCGTDAVGMDRNNSEMLTWSEMLLGERSGRRQDHSFKCRHILNQEKKKIMKPNHLIHMHLGNFGTT